MITGFKYLKRESDSSLREDLPFLGLDLAEVKE